jgi:hypothetical protein
MTLPKFGAEGHATDCVAGTSEFEVPYPLSECRLFLQARRGADASGRSGRVNGRGRFPYREIPDRGGHTPGYESGAARRQGDGPSVSSY